MLGKETRPYLWRMLLWTFWRGKAIYHLFMRGVHRGDGSHGTFDHCLAYWWSLQYAEDQFKERN